MYEQPQGPLQVLENTTRDVESCVVELVLAVQAFVKELHANKQYWVPIVDPGIKVDPGYPAYDQGLAAHAFITDVTGQPFLGQVGVTQNLGW